MTSDSRPNPDELLAQVQAEERRQKRGRLKIFFGYSAGVGKTYAMLEEAGALARKGMDVVVGYAETHGRPETEVLLKGLEVIPRKRIEYRGIGIDEMDLDAVLARKPKLVLVDELAHTNAPGSRHQKRYQDVEEVLDAGIDVYATLNIQHLESLNDAIAQITKVTVRETVPDKILDEADEIKIIDLPPQDLIQRFKEGKVYVPASATRAMANFFNRGNLIALREMLFRRAADRVDEQMREYMRELAISGPWPAGERLLVCIGDNMALNERLVRTTKRLADELGVKWIALNVDTPTSAARSVASRKVVEKTMALAESMGGEAQRIFGISVAEDILRFARKNNITKIVVGNPVRGRLRESLFRSVADQLIRLSGPIDVYVITEERHVDFSRGDLIDATGDNPKTALKWTNIIYSCWIVAIVSIISFILYPYIDLVNIAMFYLLAVVVTAVAWGLWRAILTAALGVLAFDFFFVPPRYTFAVSSLQYVITFLAFLAVGVIISLLVVRAQNFASAARVREAVASRLYAYSGDLSASPDQKSILDTVLRHISMTLGWGVAILLPEKDRLLVRAATPETEVDDHEMAVGIWSFQHGIIAGRGTSTLSGAKFRFIPMRTSEGIAGVIGVRPREKEAIGPDQERMLIAFANQAALALERLRMSDELCRGDEKSLAEGQRASASRKPESPHA